MNATAKSRVWVSVQRLVPSPCTTTSLPRRIRSMAVQPPRSGTLVPSYVCEGRMIVAGKPRSRYAATSRSSLAILSREYCQYGFRSGVDSVIGRRATGFW